MENADDAALDQRMAALCGVRVNVATGVFLRAVTHCFVTARILFPDADVRRVFVSDDAGLPVHFFADSSLQGGCGHIRHNATANLAFSLDGTEHSSLVACASGSADAFVSGLAANISFVAFNSALEWRGVTIWGHCKANPVHQEQRGLVTDLAVPFDLQRGYALLRRTSPPECIAPVAQLDSGFLIDRADTHGVLFLAIMAAP